MASASRKARPTGKLRYSLPSGASSERLGVGGHRLLGRRRAKQVDLDGDALAGPHDAGPAAEGFDEALE